MAIDLRRGLAATLFLGGAALVALSGATAVAAAVTGVTVTSGGCSGGGSSYCFNPEQANANSGDTVTWTNNSNVAHTVTSCTSAACPGAAANSGSQTFDTSLASAPGSTGSVTFTQAGSYTYYCKIHGYAAMHGTVTVAAAATQSATPAPSQSAAASQAPAATQAPSTSAGVVTTVPGTGADILPNLAAGAGLMALGGVFLLRRRRA